MIIGIFGIEDTVNEINGQFVIPVRSNYTGQIGFFFTFWRPPGFEYRRRYHKKEWKD
jgi:hypothetical protein